MTTAVIEAATQAAFTTKYRHRIWYRFDAQPHGVQLRWSYVAAKVVDGSVTNGRQFRAAYVDGFPDMKAWTEIGRDEREAWDLVFQAAERAWHAAAAQERKGVAA